MKKRRNEKTVWSLAFPIAVGMIGAVLVFAGLISKLIKNNVAATPTLSTAHGQAAADRSDVRHGDNRHDSAGYGAPYGEYYRLCKDYETQYGTASYYQEHWFYMTGLLLVRCVDFDNNGTDELLLCYSKSDHPQGRDDYVCEVWGWDGQELQRLLRLSEFNTYLTVNGTWPCWVSLSSYKGHDVLLTQTASFYSENDMVRQTIYMLDEESGQFTSTTLVLDYGGSIMNPNTSSCYYLDGLPVDADSAGVFEIQHCFEDCIVYEVKSGSGSMYSAICSDDLVEFTGNSIEKLLSLSGQEP